MEIVSVDILLQLTTRRTLYLFFCLDNINNIISQVSKICLALRFHGLDDRRPKLSTNQRARITFGSSYWEIREIAKSRCHCNSESRFTFSLDAAHNTLFTGFKGTISFQLCFLNQGKQKLVAKNV